MSYETDAVLYWGFPIAPSDYRAAEAACSKWVQAGQTGDCQDDVTLYIAIKASVVSVGLGGWARLEPSRFAVPPAWERELRRFCDETGVRWSDDGPGWYLAAARF